MCKARFEVFMNNMSEKGNKKTIKRQKKKTIQCARGQKLTQYKYKQYDSIVYPEKDILVFAQELNLLDFGQTLG